MDLMSRGILGTRISAGCILSREITLTAPAAGTCRASMVSNSQVGTMEIFLVHIGADSTGAYFEAVFN